MPTRPRPILSLILSVALAFAGVIVAGARGQTGPEGTLVTFCSGGGLIQAVIGPDGKPTGGLRVCPDLAATALAAIALDPVLPVRPAATVREARPAAALSALTRPGPAPSARGPPPSPV